MKLRDEENQINIYSSDNREYQISYQGEFFMLLIQNGKNYHYIMKANWIPQEFIHVINCVSNHFIELTKLPFTMKRSGYEAIDQALIQMGFQPEQNLLSKKLIIKANEKCTKKR